MNRFRELLYWSGTGALVGVVVLGVGGRLAMRWIALETGAPGAFTVSGTTTVVLLGAVTGAAGGALHVLARWVSAGRNVVRLSLYALAMLLLTWRGVNPIDTTKVIAFFPLVIVFMIILEWRWMAARRSAPAPTVTSPAANPDTLNA